MLKRTFVEKKCKHFGLNKEDDNKKTMIGQEGMDKKENFDSEEEVNYFEDID